MLRNAVIALAGVVLAATAASAIPTHAAPGSAYARIGQSVYVDGPRVTPLAVLADSRCPQGVACVWPGTVRVSVRIDLGARSENRVLELRRPQHVADGAIELRDVRPARTTKSPIPARDYRFAFRFQGGI